MEKLADSGSLILIIVSCSILLFPFVFGIITLHSVYKRNVERLDATMSQQRIKPERARFMFSWITYCVLAFIPLIIIQWLFIKDISYTTIVVLFLFLLFESFIAYPYYILAISFDKINGATKWGWFWKRTEIMLDEIDTTKISQQRFTNALGLTIIHSKNGTKIRTLGLSKEQLAEIIMLADTA